MLKLNLEMLKEKARLRKIIVRYFYYMVNSAI